MLAANASASQNLHKQSSAAIWSMAIAGVGATLIAGAFAMWMTTMKITRPLARMIERMKALAKGDHGIEIDGVLRRDEIGEMAGAVQVFKSNAIRRVQARAGGRRPSLRGGGRAARVEGEKARAAATQGKAMASLGDGLKRIAGGDLTTRLDSDFPAEFARIREDFNAASEKLMETPARRHFEHRRDSCRRAGHLTASDNLSQRTEQQAASLEETAAALVRVTKDADRSRRKAPSMEPGGRQRRRRRQKGRDHR